MLATSKDKSSYPSLSTMNSENKTTVFGQFLKFIQKTSQETAVLKIQDFFKFLSVMYVLNLILVIITMIFMVLFLKQDSHKVSKFLSEGNAWQIFLLIVIFAPIREELTFRMSLKENKITLAYDLAFLIIFIAEIFIPLNSISN